MTRPENTWLTCEQIVLRKGLLEMDIRNPAAQPHKTLLCVLMLGFIVFINCCGFPVYNLNKEWPLQITTSYLFLVPWSAVFTGRTLAGCFPGKRFAPLLATVGLLTYMGLGCRFLLEFGEVSNSYNFTLRNILLHTFVFIALCSLSWLHALHKNLFRI